MINFKRIIFVLIAVSFLMTFGVKTVQAVELSLDPNLDSVVRGYLNKPEGTITDADMANLTGWFNANSCNISSIQGMEYAINMDSLYLHTNQISDISPVSGLTNLYALNLDANQISNISPVSGLTNLVDLLLQINQISDISAVSGLTNLTRLNLGHNQINDISAISELTNLVDLRLYNNQISDISPVSGLTDLTYLSLPSNQISNISPVSELTNLTLLSLHTNQISDISAISGLTNLPWLSLHSNQISNISAVSGLTNLNRLYLSYNQISDISAVSGLANLITLHLRANQISNISPIAGLTNLTYLHLDNNQISDISAVSGLTNLTLLHLNNNQIETLDLSHSSFASLQDFNIENNPITNVLLVDATLSQDTFSTLMDGGSDEYQSPIGIAEMTGVLYLDMSGVDFGDISDFSKMYTLDDLETLLLTNATNLDGSEVVAWTNELNSLNYLDVVGAWESFDTTEQVSLIAWDAIVGNTLVTAVPEPATLTMLLILSTLVLLRKKV